MPARARLLGAAAKSSRKSKSLRASEFVEYERVPALKLRLLKLLFAIPAGVAVRVARAPASFRSIVEREGDLLRRFATYCALDE